MRPVLTVLSLVAAVAGIAAIAVSFATHPPYLAFRIVASVLLIDQASMTLLYLRLPVDIRPLRMALRVGAALAMAAGALLLVWCSLPRDGAVESVMAAVGVLLLAHGALTLRALATTRPAETV